MTRNVGYRCSSGRLVGLRSGLSVLVEAVEYEEQPPCNRLIGGSIPTSGSNSFAEAGRVCYHRSSPHRGRSRRPWGPCRLRTRPDVKYTGKLLQVAMIWLCLTDSAVQRDTRRNHRAVCREAVHSINTATDVGKHSPASTCPHPPSRQRSTIPRTSPASPHAYPQTLFDIPAFAAYVPASSEVRAGRWQ